MSQNDLIDAKTKGKNDSFTINQTPKQITVSGYIDLADTSGADATGNQLATMMMSSADIHISIKFPYKVTSSTGEISADKRTVTWRPKIGEKTQLQAVIAIPTVSYVLYLGGLIALIIILVALGLFLRARNKRQKELQLETEMENQPPLLE